MSLKACPEPLIKCVTNQFLNNDFIRFCMISYGVVLGKLTNCIVSLPFIVLGVFSVSVTLKIRIRSNTSSSNKITKYLVKMKYDVLGCG